MLTKFNVGDRVRYNLVSGDGRHPHEGKIVEARAVESGEAFYHIRLPNGIKHHGVREDDIVEVVPKFKVGDRVTIYHPQFPGHIGTLAAAVPRWDGERIWTVDRPKGKPIPVPENMLKLLDEPAARTWPTNDTADAIGGRSVEALSIFYNAEGGVEGVVHRDRSKCDATAHPSATIAWLAKGLRTMMIEHFGDLPDEPAD